MNTTTNTTALRDSFAYRTVMPWTLISLCLLYVHILLFRFIMWQYQRYKRKRDRANRQRLEMIWRKRIVQLKQPKLQVPAQAHQQQPFSFDSSITLVDNNTPPLRHYNTKQEEEDDDDRTVIGVESSHSNNKELQMLWQWSVTMGYCRYHHGYYMNRIIQKLVENKKMN